MKKKRKMKKQGVLFGNTNRLWLEYLKVKVDLVSMHIKEMQEQQQKEKEKE